MELATVDRALINTFRNISVPIARFGLFIIFFWFGLLKVLGMSPASQLVSDLLQTTLPALDPGAIVVLFGVFELLIGVLFIIPGVERVAIPLLFLHMFATCLPLFVMRDVTWSAFFTPTLEGQYIIKNVALIVAAVVVAASLQPFKKKS